MGYPMNYTRVVGRNNLGGDYENQDATAEFSPLPLIRGDMRRLEKDQQDEAHIAAYARRAGTTFAQAKQILADVFADQDVLWLPAPNTPEAHRPEVYACDDEMPLDPDAIRIQFNEWWASWNKAGLSGIDKEIAFDAFDAAAHLYKEAASSPQKTISIRVPPRYEITSDNLVEGEVVDKKTEQP